MMTLCETKKFKLIRHKLQRLKINLIQINLEPLNNAVLRFIN